MLHGLQRAQVATISLGGPAMLCFHRLENNGRAGPAAFEVRP